jgi:hypothetical protein
MTARVSRSSRADRGQSIDRCWVDIKNRRNLSDGFPFRNKAPGQYKTALEKAGMLEADGKPKGLARLQPEAIAKREVETTSVSPNRLLRTGPMG